MQVILNGLISGLSVALLAVGFQVVFLPTRVFFVGIAGLYAVAPYTYLAIRESFGGEFVAVIGCLVIIVGLALMLEWVNHSPLSRKGASEGAHLISSLGIYIMLVQFVAMIGGNDIKTLRTGLDSTLWVGGAVLTYSQLLIAGVASVLLLGFVGMLRATDLGLRLRALADNPEQFALFGYNVDRHRLLAFGLAGLFAAAASLLTAYDIGFHPYTGLPAMLLAVVAVIAGGRSSFIGPIIGGLLLSEIRSEVVWYFSTRWQEAVTFAVLATVILFRPQGIFGGKTRIEALT
jgi:branched-chain amino acid transport system permease protein